MNTISAIGIADHALVRTFCGRFSDMDHLQEELHAESGSYRRPAVNIAETVSEYLLELALPGYKKTDLQVLIEGDMLMISGVASCVPEHYEEVLHFYKKEFCVESFTRTFLLPEDIDTASANLEEGILFIHLKKGAVRILPVNGPGYSECIPIH
ncbi:Hsp20/alpha crystallin family protein [Paraflavitalea speifideaquila]|uniref:Hsp20/alpha crystallin family protein n=1 Tax=Paraflavitalea speifideaquila TaxID=3076558 RepID=UPI0028E59718|nr:Hsp20/alpha crystallin family protein [Paraflavitalea speifideiaquila]